MSDEKVTHSEPIEVDELADSALEEASGGVDNNTNCPCPVQNFGCSSNTD